MDDIDNATARELRANWFRFLDTVEPLRAPLHAYCLKLTHDVWDAEDLVQDTLLKGFAMIARGDLHGPGSPVADARAYLFRAATHQWIDAQRRLARQRTWPVDPPASAESAPPDGVQMAARTLFSAASPQARAAVILKDVFEFTLAETADALRTTVAAVKAALHRGRESLKDAALQSQPDRHGPSPELVDRFIAAFNSGDVALMTATLTETCSIEVPGVGGGRGRRGGWAEASAEHGGVRLQAVTYRGEIVVLFFDSKSNGLYDVVRLEEADGLVARLIHHCFCPETVRVIGAELGLATSTIGYHQPAAILRNMIATTTLPWADDGAKLH